MTEINSFYFDRQQLDFLARKFHDQYLNARPFPHIILDDFLPTAVIKKIVEEFPSSETFHWKALYNPKENKASCEDETKLGKNTRHLIYQFNSSPFLEFLERLTGINGLIPDPHLRGGGLHQIGRGGYLKIHADFNYYPKLKLERRINLLLYLNENWQEEYGGHLELWNKEMAQCEKKALPILNRCLIFSTTDSAYHGNPDPLNCPPNRYRRSLALYYYTSNRPSEEKTEPHFTLFKKRPGENWQKRSLFKKLLEKISKL